MTDQMERFPRGSLPPNEFKAVATVAPTAVSKPPVVVTADAAAPEPEPPAKQCDLSTTCPNCNSQMQPEHAHYRCAACGYRDSCCF
jgi:hypothetical protein